MTSRQSCQRTLVLLASGCLGACSDAAPDGAAVTSVAAPLTATYDWLQFGGDPAHSGNNTRETGISATTVAQLTRTFQVTLPAVADGAPVLLTAVSTASGVRDLLFVTTKDGRLLALDAHTGATIWSVQHGSSTCRINNGSSVCYTTSSPAIDPRRQFVYSYGLEGGVHKHDVATGAETTTGGWPALTSTKTFDEKGSSPLVFATARSGLTYLYMSHGGYPGDRGDYQGHVTAINLADGSQHVFNALCSDQTVHFVTTPGAPDCADVRGAVWARAGVVYDGDNDRLFVGTGNGPYAPTRHAWSDTVFAINPNGTGNGGNPLDAYTPTNFAALDSADADVGSTAPAILPVPATSRFPHLGLQSGKDGMLRLINLDNLSGQGGPGHTAGEIGAIVSVPQGGGVLPALATWMDPATGDAWAFVANGRGISGLRISLDASGNPSLVTGWQSANAGTSPIVANGVLFYASSNIIRALNPKTGALLWSSTGIGGIHWESPVVASGVAYISDESSHLSAFAVPAGGGTGGSGAGTGGTGGTGAAGGATGSGGAGGRTGGFVAKINFQLPATPTPTGYVPDTGAVFGARGGGLSYGWNADNSAQARWRHSSAAPDVLHDTLIHLQKPANPNASWELAVPNGRYTVRIVSGDPDNIDSVFRLNAEGVLALSGTPTSAQHWVDAASTIMVGDGRLSITNGSGSSNNKIDFIEVTQQ